MENILQWMLGIPETLAGFANWLTTPISDLLPFSPLQALGTGALAVVAIILVAKIIHLIVG